MTHPTDAELEAVAQRLELVAPTDVEVVDMLRACKGRVRVKSPEAVERFDLEQPTHPMGSAWMEPAPRYGDWVRYSDYAALSAALESERAEAARRKWEDWRQIATLARASAEAAEAERDALKAELVSTLSAAILDAQIRALGNRQLDTPDQIRANACAFLARHQKGAGV